MPDVYNHMYSPSWFAANGVQNPLAFGQPLVTKNPNSFFGPIGGFAAGRLGLTAMASDGTMQPIFRTNLFDRPNFGVTSSEHAAMAANARLMNAVSEAGMARIGESVSRVFAEGGGAFGRMAYATDANGMYTQPEIVRRIASMAEHAAGSPMVAGQVNSLVNQWLGYDRGAGEKIFAANAQAITSSFKSALSRDASGNLRYNSRGLTGEDRELANQAVAVALTGATQGAMYGKNLTKNWDVTHNVSEGFAADYLTRAAMGGLFVDNSKMSSEDKKKRDDIDALRSDINGMLAQREELEGARRNAKGDRRTRLERMLRDLDADIEYKAGEAQRLEDSITTHNGFGTLEDFTKEMVKKEKERRARERELNDIDLAESRGETTKYSRDEIEKKRNELESLNREIEWMKRDLDKTAEGLLGGISGAVDVLKDFAGGEREAKDLLYQITGGKAVSAAEGKSIERTFRELEVRGKAAGLTSAQVGAIYNRINDATGSAFGMSAMDMGLFGGPAKAALAATGTALATKAMAGASSDREREQILAGAEWRGAQYANSNVAKALVQLRSAYNDKAISEDEYTNYLDAMVSGNEQSRISAINDFHKRVYGSTEEGRRQMSSPAEMAFMISNLSSRDQMIVGQNLAVAAGSDDLRAASSARASRGSRRGANRLVSAGFSWAAVSDIGDKASYKGMLEALNSASVDNKAAEMASKAVQEEYDAAYAEAIREGKTPDEADREASKSAMDLYNRVYKSTVGDVDAKVQEEIGNYGKSEFDKYYDAVAISGESLSSGVSGLLDGLGILEDGGGISRGNLAAVGKSVMDLLDKQGSSTLRRLGLGDGVLSDARVRMNEALERGDYEEYQRILGEEILPKVGNNQTMAETIRRELGKSGLESSSARKSRESASGKSAAESAAVGAEAARSITGEDPATAAAIVQMNNAGKMFAEEDDPALEELEKEESENREAAKKNQSTSEILLDTMTGAASWSDLFMNPDVARRERVDALAAAAESQGFAVVRDSNGEIDVGKSFNEDSVRTLGEYESGSSVVGAMEQDLVRGLFSASDNDLSEYYKALGASDKDVEKFLKKRRGLFDREKGEKGRKSTVKELLKDIRNRHEKASGTASDVGAKAVENVALKRLGAIGKAIDDGDISFGKEGMRELFGGGAGGGGGGGQLESVMAALINKVGELVAVLQARNVSGTGPGG